MDLYFYARRVAPLERVFDRFREKYRGLTFFEDAEAEAMPDLLVAATWEEIRAFFRDEAARLFRELYIARGRRR